VLGDLELWLPDWGLGIWEGGVQELLEQGLLLLLLLSGIPLKQQLCHRVQHVAASWRCFVGLEEGRHELGGVIRPGGVLGLHLGQEAGQRVLGEPTAVKGEEGRWRHEVWEGLGGLAHAGLLEGGQRSGDTCGLAERRAHVRVAQIAT
jgi:hypothetical protein